METESSLASSQELATGPYPVPAHVLTPYFFKIHFNNILSSTPRFSKWSLSFRFSD
jgi:hypothetical protein